VAYIGRYLAAKCDEEDTKREATAKVIAVQEAERKREADAKAEAEFRERQAAEKAAESEQRRREAGDAAQNAAEPASDAAAVDEPEVAESTGDEETAATYATLSTDHPSMISHFAVAPLSPTEQDPDEGAANAGKAPLLSLIVGMRR
jgi:ATPase subunit of ABC transporter with duplicated ATPase domains